MATPNMDFPCFSIFLLCSILFSNTKLFGVNPVSCLKSLINLYLYRKCTTKNELKIQCCTYVVPDLTFVLKTGQLCRQMQK